MMILSLLFRITDEELAERLGLVVKDVNRTAAKLKEERLLAVESRQEVRQSDQKTVNRTYYYIDFVMFVNVVKYKLYMMKKQLESQLKSVVLGISSCVFYWLGYGE